MICRNGRTTSEVRENMRGGKGAVTIRHWFRKDEFGASVRLCARLIIPPGAGIGPHQHEGEDEVYIVLKGSGVLDDGQQREAVGPGDAVLTGRGGSHSVENSGDEDLELAAIIACYEGGA